MYWLFQETTIGGVDLYVWHIPGLQKVFNTWCLHVGSLCLAMACPSQALKMGMIASSRKSYHPTVAQMLYDFFCSLMSTVIQDKILWLYRSVF